MNKLFIITGPSGSGKTTTMRQVMKNEVVSFTTRPMRKGEVDGVDYIFISQDEFDSLMSTGGIAESTTYYGTASYGITMGELEYKLSQGHAFVIVDVVGKAQLEKLYSNTVSIFFRSDIYELEKRMLKRGDDRARVSQRMLTVDEELNNFYLYDYIVDNVEGSQDQAIESVKYILGKETGDVHKYI